MTRIVCSTKGVRYLRVEVDERHALVSFAFVEPGGQLEWVLGERGVLTGADGPKHYAQILVGGPSTGATVELHAGTYDVWIRRGNDPGAPASFVGQLVIRTP